MAIPAVDFHIHSQFSLCSEDTSIRGIISVAEEKGLQRIAITDHGTTENPPWFNRYLSEVEGARKNTHVDVLTGLEVNIEPDGRLAVSHNILKDLDVVIGALHSIPSERSTPKEYVTIVTKALEINSIDILAHPTYIVMNRKRVPSAVAESIIPKLRDEDTAVEINYHHRDPSPNFLRKCVMARVKLTPSSDAHKLEEIGHFEWFEQMAVQIGEDIVWI